MQSALIQTLMKEAYREALTASKNDEVPVASLIYWNGKVLSKCHNRTRSLKNPLMHSESIAIDNALAGYPDSVLRESILITTLEPCIMCSGKILLSKIKEVHFGAAAPKSGAVISLYNMFDDSRLNHKPVYSYGYMEKEIGSLLSSFFQHKRETQRSLRDACSLE